MADEIRIGGAGTQAVYQIESGERVGGAGVQAVYQQEAGERVGGVGVQVVYSLNKILGITGIASEGAFGAHTISNVGGVQELTPGAINSQEAIGSLSVIAEAVVSPEGIASSQAFGEPNIQGAAVRPEGIVTAQAFGEPSVIPGQVILQPEGIATDQAFGGSSVVLIIRPIRWQTFTSFPGDPWILYVRLSPFAWLCYRYDGIPSQEGIGVVTVQPGAVEIAPTGIGSEEAIGSPTLIPVVWPNEIGSEEGFGTLQLNLKVKPAAIESGEGIGGVTVQPGPVEVAPGGISCEEAIGSPAIILLVSPIGVESEESFGTLQLNLEVKPAAIESGEGVGDPVMGGYVRIEGGVITGEDFGTPRLKLSVIPAAIVSGEGLGAPEAVPGPVYVRPLALESQERFGRTWVKRPRNLATLIVLEVKPLPLLEFTDGLETEDLYDSPIRMVVNG